MATWHYALGQQTYGPVSDDVLRSLATQGVLGPMSNVLPAGSASWTPLYVHEAALGLRRVGDSTYVLSSGAVPTAAPVMPGPGMPPPPPPGYTQMANPVRGLEYSGWWRRVLALVLDTIILLIPTLIIMVIAVDDLLDDVNNEGSVNLDTQFSQFDTVGAVVASVIAIALTICYFGIQHGKWGQTIGKRATGIKVVDADSGQVIGMGRAFARVAFTQATGAVPYLGAVFNLLDVLWPLWDDRNQALHDKVVRSVVVRAYS